MKTLVLVIVSLVILAVASSCSNRQGGTPRPEIWDIGAKDVQTDPNTSTVRARGEVRIQIDTSIISADEADIQYVDDGATVQLRGNVRLRVAQVKQ